MAAPACTQATPHRVRSSPTADRLSIPFFFDPHFGAVVRPLCTHPPVAAHLAACAAAGVAPSRLDLEQGTMGAASAAGAAEIEGGAMTGSGGILYGEYITNKVKHCFPDLFAASASEADATGPV